MTFPRSFESRASNDKYTHRAILAAPANDGTTAPTVTSTAVPIIVPDDTVTPWTGHNTVQPTVCNLYPTGTTIVVDGVTTTMEPTVYATGFPIYSSRPTSTAVPQVIESRDNFDKTAKPTIVKGTPALTTLWPDATNGGVYIDQTITSTNSGGGVTVVTSTGYAWPTVCSISPISVTLLTSTALATAIPTSATGTTGGTSEALKSTKDNNGARALGAPAMMLGAAAGVFVLVL